MFKEFSDKAKSFRDETSAWYNYLALLWAIGLSVAPFAERYIFGGQRLYFALFAGVLVLITLALLAWTSYKLRAVVDRDRLYYGFQRLEKTIIYSVDKHNTRYTLEYIDKVKAVVDQRILYPIRYKWSGDGAEGVPELKNKNQQLVAVVGKSGEIGPYITSKQRSPGDEWHYYFVALNPPAHKSSEPITINYTQEFRAGSGRRPGPFINCLIIGSLDRLTLEARLPAKPKTVTVCYFKPGSHKAEGVRDGMSLLDPGDNRIIQLVEPKPRNGYRYQIEWTL